jgi:putative membrane protein (TIGR04086 family)
MVRNLNQANKATLNDNITLFSIAKGIIISYVITVPTFMLFALILTNTDFPEKYTSPVVVITTIISVLTAGSSATRGMKNKGWLNGCIIGFIYMFILYIISSMILKNFQIDKYVITMTIIGILTGAIGGIIGINFKRSSRIRHIK